MNSKETKLKYCTKFVGGSICIINLLVKVFKLISYEIINCMGRIIINF